MIANFGSGARDAWSVLRATFLSYLVGLCWTDGSHMAASRRAGMALLIAPVVGLGLLTGCSGDAVTYAGERVRDPETFLRDVEARWRSDLDGQRVTRHQQARCYFSTPAETKDLDGSVFCGPVRYFVDRAEQDSESDNPDADQDRSVAGPGLWDRYSYRAFEGSDGYGLTEPNLRARGTDLPGGLELLRPDAQQPPRDGEQLAAPTPPPVEAGYLDSAAEVDISKARKPKDGRIVTPKVTVTVEQVGTTDQIRTDDETMGPARGERFVVATLSFDDGPFAATYDDGWGRDGLVDADVTYAVRVGDDRRQFNWQDSSQPDPNSQRTIVVSVPRSVEPFLVVSAAGRDQQVSLTTGERGGDAVTGFYHERTEVGVSRQYAASQFVSGDFQLSYSLLFARARLTPFDPTRGWAQEGKAWLFLDTEQVGIHWPSYPYSLHLDRAATATVLDDQGSTSHDLGKSETWDGSAGDISPVFEVDADATTFHLTYRPTFTFSSPGGGGYEPATGSGSLQTLQFDLRF